MRDQLNHFSALIKRLGIIVLIFMLLRFIFYVYNYDHFGPLSFSQAISILYGGLRFDLSAVVYYNILFILVSLLPFAFRQKNWYAIITKWVFYIVNIFAFLIATGDLEYFRFNGKRISVDVLSIAGEGSGLIFQLLRQYWFLLIILGLCIFLLHWLYQKTKTNKPFKELFLIQLLILVLAIPLTIIVGRGGKVNERPLSIIMASAYTSVQNIPLVTNSPFTFLTSLFEIGVDEKHYFSKTELENIFRLEKQYHFSTPQNKENVVLIILEGFSMEYIGSLNNYKGYTPFLDSLVRNSLVFRNAVANAERSIKGIPAIIASLPSFMDNAYLVSPYQGNCFKGIASCLKQEAYHTSFFHGGTNGTMHLNSFSATAGFDHYFGRTEFNNETHFDGAWGIYDEPFLQYFGEMLSTFPQPFFSTVFTLSSHHPFPVPEKYKGKFPKGELEVIESIGYTDYSLKQFFEYAKHQHWFKNTLFVITSDHPFKPDAHYLPEFKLTARKFAIPLIFYKPSEIAPIINKKIANQFDIMPSILDRVGYSHKFKSFGESVFSENHKGRGIEYQNRIFQIFDKEHILYFNGNNAIGLYNYKTDSLEKTDLLNINNKKYLELDSAIKAFVQTYNLTLIKNSYCN